ncbi:DUF4328 domain-containing protein [Streptomyces kanamyceticus]|uniref:DUF4328 domain-containing protein n=1 Tax=Streptomyces kanamyceticus TaxID=1967 RepID=A0A5J6GCU8_STRKN|nr:DUF4328 domain-containing protein [Streptomyces kanamyceticus]QEU92282.1 DUF4328 domain-containing protein [Streptomyces kanamyceticus]
MLCKECQSNTATTSEGLCDGCVTAAAYAAAPPPARPGSGPATWLRSPVGLGRAVMALLGVVIAVDLYALWAATAMRGVMNDLISGEYGEDIELDAEHADTLYASAGGLQLVALLATCVVFLVWFHRVRVNAEVFDPHVHSKSRGWTVGSWFVPVVNLWFPRRIAIDIWDASGDRSKSLEAPGERETPWLINAWWALWLVSITAGRLAGQRYSDAEEPEKINSALTGMMVSDALDVVAAVLAILFVHRLTRMQDEKARSGPGAVPGGLPLG